MASTYSALKIELLETGANAGTWGTATNVNLGDAVLGEAITGSATVDFATDADVTITLTDSATTQSARNLRLNITESSTGIGSVRNLILGSGCQIEKFYLINNTGTGAKTVKNTSGTGISVPAGKATLVYNNGTNVVDAASYFTSLTLGSALPVASGGTGTASPALVQGANITITGTWPNQTIAAAAPGTGTVTSVSGTGTVNGISLSGSVTTSGSLTLGGTLSGVNLASQVTGTLPIGNGGTGTTSTTFANLTTNVTGTLPVANGGTGAATLTANNVILGNGTSAPLFVAPSSSGNVLTSNGSTWQSTAPAASALVLVASATASNSSSIVFTSLSSSYRAYMLEYDSVYMENGGQNLLMTISTNNGSTYQSTGYMRSLTQVLSSANTVSGNSSTGDSVFYIGSLNGFASTSTNTGSGTVYIFAPNSSGKYSTYYMATVTYNDGNINEMVAGGMTNKATTSAINAFKLASGSGNITAGNFRLYGLTNA